MPYGVPFPVMPGHSSRAHLALHSLVLSARSSALALTVPLLFAYAFLWQCEKGLCDIRTQKIEGLVDILGQEKIDGFELRFVRTGWKRN